MFSLVLLSIFWIAYKGLHFIRLFETKEYRLDRFQATIHDRGFVSLFYTLKIQLPSRSLRNIQIVSFHFLVTLTIFLYAFENIYVYNFLSTLFFLAPFAAFVIALTGVTLTTIPSYIYRWIIIQRARWKIRNTKTIFIGVTGSFGKTSVKEYMHDILSKKFNVAKTDDNMNTDIGIALSILRNLKKDTEYFIIEAGSYKKGEIKKATHYIPFSYTVLTGLGNQHLDLYGSRENLIKEKLTLIHSLSKNGVAYVNYEISDINTLGKNSSPHVVTYGLSGKSDIYASHYQTTHTSSSARIHYKNSSFMFQCSLLGRHSIQNLLPAIALAYDLGIKPLEIETAIKKINQRKGKLSVHRGYGKSIIVHDDVDPNVNGFLSAIEILRHFPQKSKIVITSGIIELGVEKRSSYEDITNKLHNYSMQLYTTDSFFKELKKTSGVLTFNDVKSLQKSLLLNVDKGTVILLEGKFPNSFIQALIVPK